MSSTQRRVRSVLARLSQIERIVCFIAFALLSSVVFIDVMLREVLGNGLPWSRQVGVYANIVVAMIGIGIASESGGHLRPRFADHWLPAQWEPGLVRVQEGVMALFCLLIASLATQLVIESFGMHEISTVLRTPIWPFQALIPLAFFIGAVRHIAYACYPQIRPESRGLSAGSRGDKEC